MDPRRGCWRLPQAPAPPLAPPLTASLVASFLSLLVLSAPVVPFCNHQVAAGPFRPGPKHAGSCFDFHRTLASACTHVQPSPLMTQSAHTHTQSAPARERGRGACRGVNVTAGGCVAGSLKRNWVRSLRARRAPEVLQEHEAPTSLSSRRRSHRHGGRPRAPARAAAHTATGAPTSSIDTSYSFLATSTSYDAALLLMGLLGGRWRLVGVWWGGPGVDGPGAGQAGLGRTGPCCCPAPPAGPGAPACVPCWPHTPPRPHDRPAPAPAVVPVLAADALDLGGAGQVDARLSALLGALGERRHQLPHGAHEEGAGVGVGAGREGAGRGDGGVESGGPPGEGAGGSEGEHARSQLPALAPCPCHTKSTAHLPPAPHSAAPTCRRPPCSAPARCARRPGAAR
jgi:hypothetical protein